MCPKSKEFGIGTLLIQIHSNDIFKKKPDPSLLKNKAKHYKLSYVLARWCLLLPSKVDRIQGRSLKFACYFMEIVGSLLLH